MVKHILESLNYLPTLVDSGEKDLSILETKTFDLVLLDMIMHPGIGGKQTYKKTNQLYPELKTIIVRGYSENEDTENTLDAGAELFIRKPHSYRNTGR